ncbi:RNA-directed DNA polymerase, eukaryota, reverse transcriptase zinc-binding domain protein [Tanacetum coccineum]
MLIKSTVSRLFITKLVISLYALNRGLIFKWVWRFLAHEPTLWSRVIKAIHGANGKIDEISGKGANSCWINIIKEVRRLEEKGINLLLFMKKKLGNGLSTLFWDDVWCDGGKLKNRFPRAYALENSKQITVGQKLAHPSLYHSFRRHPRGGLELTQVEELAKVINPVVLTQSPDSWSWTLNNSGGYTVASSRNMIDSRLLPKGDLKTRWIRYVPNKVNTFAWKVMTNSLPTRFNISRRGIDIESLSCVNCDVGIETNDHLFFACNTAKKISKLINRWWDVPFMDINSYGEWRSWIDNVKLPKKNKSMFQGNNVYLVKHCARKDAPIRSPTGIEAGLGKHLAQMKPPDKIPFGIGAGLERGLLIGFEDRGWPPRLKPAPLSFLIIVT